MRSEKRSVIRQSSTERCQEKLSDARLFLKFTQRNNNQIRTLGNSCVLFIFDDASLSNGMQILHHLCWA